MRTPTHRSKRGAAPVPAAGENQDPPALPEYPLCARSAPPALIPADASHPQTAQAGCSVNFAGTGPRPAAPSLRAQRGFQAYWLGEATSLAGTSVYAVALPVIAAMELGASPGQVSALASAVLAPGFVLALPAGVAGDRHPKKRLMVGTDLMAAGAVAAVPVSWAVGALSMPVLYGVALLLGALTVLHQAAAIAIVPELVEPGLVHAANGRVMAAYAVARSVGTYGGTAAVSLLGAARCLLLDSCSYLVSAWCASRIPAATAGRPSHPRLRMVTSIREGIAHVMRDEFQRPLVLTMAFHAFAEGIGVTYFAYYLLTVLKVGSFGLGVVTGATGTGSLLGALAARRQAGRLGPGAVLLVGFAAYPLCSTPVLLAQPGAGWLIVLAAVGALQAAASTAAAATQRSIRQELCPPHLQSRVQQTSVWLVSGSRLLAALTGGAIAHVAGVWAALLASVLLLLCPVVMLWASPVRQLAVMPSSAADLLGPATAQSGDRSAH